MQIISTGSYLPELVVTNTDLSKFLDTNDEWITTRSGIRERHIATHETTSDLGVRAALLALERSQLAAKDIELVICATISPDTSVPMVAANIKKKLAIENAVAFDVSAICSGFVYALTIADSMMKTGGYKNALVIGADVNSQIVDWKDRSTCVLFGDGAGAVVLSNTDERGIISTYLNCIIDSEDILTCNNRLDPTPFSGSQRLENVKVKMNGSKTMRFAVKALHDAIDVVIKKGEVSLADIKMIVPHQANARILQYAAKDLGIDINKFYINIDKTGNTSSATIPIALDEMVGKDLIHRGDLMIFVAFGGGLTSGAVLVEW